VSEVGSNEGSINEDSEDKEDDDENMEIDSEEEDDSELEYDSGDPWEDLRANEGGGTPTPYFFLYFSQHPLRIPKGYPLL